MFKNGDYIVCVERLSKKHNSLSAGFKENYCFQINSHLNSDDVFFPADGSGWWEDTIRHATPEEIAEYERLGKPFDVTTIVSIPVNNDYTYLVKFLKKLGIK